MAWTFHKIKVYTKLLGTILMLLVVVAFILSNRDRVSVKFLWKQTPEIPQYIFIVIVGVGSIIVYQVIRRLRRLVLDFRAVRSDERTQRKLIADRMISQEQKSS